MKAALVGFALVLAVVGIGLLELGGIPRTKHGWLVALVVAPFAWLASQILGELVYEGINRLPFGRWVNVLVFWLILLTLFIGYYMVRSWLAPSALPWWDSFFRN